ncbi:MAG: hypothetical protein M1134_05275 [Actinobacteria bacterium]|nr:hypothetical protein [Actinomycetota bacterium]
MTDDTAERYEVDADEADALEFGSGTPVEVKAGPQRMSAFAVRFDPDDAVPVEADEALRTLRRLVVRR